VVPVAAVTHPVAGVTAVIGSVSLLVHPVARVTGIPIVVAGRICGAQRVGDIAARAARVVRVVRAWDALAVRGVADRRRTGATGSSPGAVVRTRMPVGAVVPVAAARALITAITAIAAIAAIADTVQGQLRFRARVTLAVLGTGHRSASPWVPYPPGVSSPTLLSSMQFRERWVTV
jgi:hypothetical protein